MKQFIWFTDLMSTVNYKGEHNSFVERSCFTEGYPAYSRSLFCPVCRRVWGEIIEDISGNPVCIPQMVSCVLCDWKSAAGRGQVPGSLIEYDLTASGIDIELLNSLPEFLVRREFLLTLKALSLP